MAGRTPEMESAIPPHTPRVQSFEYQSSGGIKVKIVDSKGILDPNDLKPDGTKRLKIETPDGRFVPEPINEQAKG